MSQNTVASRWGNSSRSGFYTLLYKELLRFWRVGFQTIAAPVITALLYLIVFVQVYKTGFRSTIKFHTLSS